MAAATEAKHALFDACLATPVAGSVAGLEVIGTLRDAGLEANRAAIGTLTASIRASSIGSHAAYALAAPNSLGASGSATYSDQLPS